MLINDLLSKLAFAHSRHNHLNEVSGTFFTRIELDHSAISPYQNMLNRYLTPKSIFIFDAEIVNRIKENLHRQTRGMNIPGETESIHNVIHDKTDGALLSSYKSLLFTIQVTNSSPLISTIKSSESSIYRFVEVDLVSSEMKGVETDLEQFAEFFNVYLQMTLTQRRSSNQASKHFEDNLALWKQVVVDEYEQEL